jgi:hypothetical protein
MGKQVLIDSNIAIGYVGGSFDSEVLDLIDSYIEEGYHLSIINNPFTILKNLPPW